MFRNENEKFLFVRHAVAGAIILGILFVVGTLPAAAADKNAVSHVYNYSYDEVFQGSQEAIQRLGWFDTGKNKDKGTISGYGMHAGCKVPFDIQIETVNAKPETKVTVSANKGGCFGIHTVSQNATKNAILSELQKVLATYH
jgi:hypothetical protein